LFWGLPLLHKHFIANAKWRGIKHIEKGAIYVYTWEFSRAEVQNISKLGKITGKMSLCLGQEE